MSLGEDRYGNWVGALVLFLQYPPLLIATFLIACAAFTFAWWLRGHWAATTIEGLEATIRGRDAYLEVVEQRLELGREQYNAVRTRLGDVEMRADRQAKEITELRSSSLTAYYVDALARENTGLQSALTSLIQSTSTLGRTLTVSAGRTTHSSG